MRMGNWVSLGLAAMASIRLLPALKDLDSSISTDMVQIFAFLDRPLQSASTASDPYNSTNILCRAGIQQPQAEHSFSLVSE